MPIFVEKKPQLKLSFASFHANTMKSNQKYLTPFELNEVLSSFQTETFNEGDTIFKQGAKADKLFFIEKGEITCWKTMRPEDPMTFIKTYKEGDSFGELALMYDYTRNYTIIAKTSVVLFSLDRKTYKNIVQGNIIRMRENYKNILEKVDILQTLTPEEISKILDIIEEREYKEGEDIVKQNANEDDFFILYNGKCHSEKISDSGKAPQLLNKYELFEFFGEIPWFKLEARNYIVKADEDCNVLVISKKKFKRLVGTLENILIAIAYWLLVVVIILFVFYIAVKINNYRQYGRNGKIERDDFMH